MDGSEISTRALKLDDLSHTDGDGVQFWYAREIMSFLGYTKWQNFEIAVKRAETSINTSKTPGEHHFAEVSKMVDIGSGSIGGSASLKLVSKRSSAGAWEASPCKEEAPVMRHRGEPFPKL